MNQTQIKYAVNRAEAIFNDKAKQIRDKYKVVPMTSEQKVLAIQEGRFTVRPEEARGYQNWSNAIIFNDQPPENVAERDAKLDVLRTQYHKVKDELVLGDDEEALRLLKAFENS